MKGIEKEQKKANKKYLSSYLAKCIQINYKYLNNNTNISYDKIYSSCLDTIVLSRQEKCQLYERVFNILENQYRLLNAHSKRDVPIYLVDLNEQKKEERD